MRDPSQPPWKSHLAAPWAAAFVWFLFGLRTHCLEWRERKQVLKTNAPIGGVWCLMNYSVRNAKHKAFWKERHFQYGALSPPRPPR